MKPRILLTEDDTVAGELFAEVLEDQGYDVDRVESGETALAHLQSSRYNLLLVDIQLPGRSGLEVTRLVRRLYPDMPVVVMTAFGTMETAIEAIQDGAFDYASKPMNIDELKQVVSRAMAPQRLPAGETNGASASTPGSGGAATNGSRPEAEPVRPLGSLIGRSGAMVDVYKTVARVAPTRSTALILGESGTGKELVARAIHEHSPRARHRFLAIDCGALPETLLESELFGHVRGAFTGAVADKKGLFEEADGNTCFLDEIGDISPNLQAKLLRVLQEGEVRRIGSQKWIKVDARIVAATNKDLSVLVRDGLFREDLYYRLNVVTITLPPLRDRVEDIPALAMHFLRQCARTGGSPMTAISDSAMQLLRTYEWPGNIRELENTIERAATLSSQKVLTVDDLPPVIRDAKTTQMMARVAAGVAGVFADAPSLEEVKRRYIRHVIVSTHGNLSRAAAILDVDRRSLYRMIERLEIDVPGREPISARASRDPNPHPAL
jgi:DNA-binding NtrC family response regulator